jgi:hypothetical protein
MIELSTSITLNINNINNNVRLELCFTSPGEILADTAITEKRERPQRHAR